MKTRISLLISNLMGGGAERVCCLLANGLLRRGHEVSIVTLDAAHVAAYPLDGAVRVVHLGACRPGRSLSCRAAQNLRRVGRIRGALQRLASDAVIGFMTESNVLATLAGRVFCRLPCRLMLNERVDPHSHNRAALACVARRLTFPFADAVVPCSRAMAPWYERWLPPRKVVPIQNPVVLDDRPPDAQADEQARRMAGENWILAMGRLHEQKGYDLLLEAFARVPARQPENWRLGILGEGDQRPELERRIEALGLGGRAELLGRFANPYPVLRAGEIFALSSRYEGFPNALTEAMACGLPAVAFDCPTGPAEIIRPEEDGLLVAPGDVDGFAKALARLMGDEQLRGRLAARAPEVLTRFRLDRFLDAWEELLGRLTRGRT